MGNGRLSEIYMSFSNQIQVYAGVPIVQSCRFTEFEPCKTNKNAWNRLVYSLATIDIVSPKFNFVLECLTLTFLQCSQLTIHFKPFRFCCPRFFEYNFKSLKLMEFNVKHSSQLIFLPSLYSIFYSCRLLQYVENNKTFH